MAVLFFIVFISAGAFLFRHQLIDSHLRQAQRALDEDRLDDAKVHIDKALATRRPPLVAYPLAARISRLRSAYDETDQILKAWQKREKKTPVFYLDAHEGALDASSLPLTEELEILLSLENLVVVIDDFRLPDDDSFVFGEYGGTRNVYTAPLEIRSAVTAKQRLIVSGLVWVWSADWKKPVGPAFAKPTADNSRN